MTVDDFIDLDNRVECMSTTQIIEQILADAARYSEIGKPDITIRQ